MKVTEKQHFEVYAMPLRSNENVANKILFGKEVSWNKIIHNYYCKLLLLSSLHSLFVFLNSN